MASEPMRGRRSTAWALRSVVLAVVVAASTSVTSNAQDDAYKPPHDRPGPAADKVYFTQFDVDRAPLDIQAGNMDLYLYGLKTEAAQELAGHRGHRAHPGARRRRSRSSSTRRPRPRASSTRSPSPRSAGRCSTSSTGTSSPRTSTGALAQPMITHVAPVGPRLPDRLRHRPRLRHPRTTRSSAAQIDRDAMTAAGAELVDGVWSYEGEPIRIKLIARVEDERREIGDLVRAELEAAGFQVAHPYQQFAAGGPARLLHRSRRPSSGTSTPRAGAAARRSATTSAASTPSTRPGWATCPAGGSRGSGSTRTRSSTSSASGSSGASSTASRSATSSTAR